MQQPKCYSVSVEKARQCLGLIRDIADRGASSWDANVVGYALQELSQVLLERTGEDERSFEPVPADEISGLEELRVELEWVDGCSREMSVEQRCN
jgi:hypothetical protein